MVKYICSCSPDVELAMRKPVFASSILQAYDESRANKISDSGELPSYDFGGRKVLVVEDNIINAEIEKNLLEMVGFTVDLAENGVDAIKAFTESRDFEYAAILMHHGDPQITRS